MEVGQWGGCLAVKWFDVSTGKIALMVGGHSAVITARQRRCMSRAYEEVLTMK